MRTALAPAWSSDWITADGRRKLSAAAIAPAPRRALPARVRSRSPSPGASRSPARAAARPDTTRTAAFGATACKALFRCESCREPFEHVKAI